MKKIYKIVEKKYLWFLISLTVILIGTSLSTWRLIYNQPVLNFGIDFTGGMSFLLKFDQLDLIPKQEQADFIQKIRAVLTDFDLQNSKIQITQDNEVLIRTKDVDTSKRLAVLKAFHQQIGDNTLLSTSEIGATIGQELKEKSLWIIGVVSFALLLFITWRFEFSFGLAALIAVIHDALITLSVASIFSLQIDTAFVAAILTILGYSINDTIVLFDRVRENLKLAKTNSKMSVLINTSIRQVWARTFNTSITTLFVIGSLIIFGGTTIKSFALVLLVGIIAGTYSSIFIACPFLTILFPDTDTEK